MCNKTRRRAPSASCRKSVRCPSERRGTPLLFQNPPDRSSVVQRLSRRDSHPRCSQEQPMRQKQEFASYRFRHPSSQAGFDLGLSRLSKPLLKQGLPQRLRARTARFPKCPPMFSAKNARSRPIRGASRPRREKITCGWPEGKPGVRQAFMDTCTTSQTLHQVQIDAARSCLTDNSSDYRAVCDHAVSVHRVGDKALPEEHIAAMIAEAPQRLGFFIRVCRYTRMREKQASTLEWTA